MLDLKFFKCKDENNNITYQVDAQGSKKCSKLDTETVEEKEERERELNDFPKIGMKIYDDMMLCVNYGKTLRGER